MQGDMSRQDLEARLSLIENMIAEGRRSTQSWGWAFVLWGIAYYIATAWSAWSDRAWIWPATMLSAVIVTICVAYTRAGEGPGSNLGRAISAIWIALGISMFVLFVPLGMSGRLSDEHLFMAVVSGILGMANGASALILRWKAQFTCAVLWWASAVTACLSSHKLSTIAFLVAVFLCQIVFGLYAVATDARQRKRRVSAHA